MTNSTALTKRPGGALARPAVDWAMARRVVKETHAPLATDAEADYFLEVCKSIEANPILREAYLVVNEYYSKKLGRNVRSCYIQVGIDWLRRKALQSGNVEAIFGPFLGAPDGHFYPEILPEGVPLYAARAGIKLRTLKETVWLSVYWDEFGGDKGNWAKMPRHMLAKVVMSHIYKFGCVDVAGVYTAEEMEAVEAGGYTVKEKRARTVPRPSDPAPPDLSSENETEEPAEVVEDGEIEEFEPVADPSVAMIGAIKKLLPVAYPGEDESGIDWHGLKEDVMPESWRGRWGSKYPQLKDWDHNQLTILIDYLQKREQKNAAPEQAEEKPEGLAEYEAALEGKTVEDNMEPETEVNPDDFGGSDE